VVRKCHPLLPGQQCPAGTSESKDCEGPLHRMIPTLGRKLQQVRTLKHVCIHIFLDSRCASLGTLKHAYIQTALIFSFLLY
jgi:hypothetical protein